MKMPNFLIVQKTSFVLLVTFSTLVLQSNANVVCPEPLRSLVEKSGCDAVKCISSYSASNCSIEDGHVWEENVSFCGCCPGCVKYNGLHLGYECDVNFASVLSYEECNAQYCPIVKNCKAGLICHKDKGTCELPPAPYPTCQGRCFLQRAVAEAPGSNFRWTPSCTADGYYEPLQKKGSRNNGDCYCVDECGGRILGRARWLNDGCSNQTCGCSRQVDKLRNQEGRIATLHCTEDGNYEALQCDTDSSLCYCVDPLSGRVMGDVLPEHQWKDLPCYDEKAPHFANSANYLRRCESEWAPGQKLSMEAKLHGLTFSIRDLDCDYDGSFKPLFKNRISIQEECVDKAGKRISTYFRNLQGTNDMNCRCARDTLFYASQGIQFTKTCQGGTGNYNPYYVNGAIAQCVDSDGYPYGALVPADLACCLELVDGDITCASPDDRLLCQALYKKCHEYLFARD